MRTRLKWLAKNLYFVTSVEEIMSGCYIRWRGSGFKV